MNDPIMDALTTAHNRNVELVGILSNVCAWVDMLKRRIDSGDVYDWELETLMSATNEARAFIERREA